MANAGKTLVAEALCELQMAGDPVPVSLSNELVRLLSEQLYQSPVKAIEELVVNAYDADASECRLWVPAPHDATSNFVLVFDDGVGMTRQGLVDLWQIGRSNKRTEEIERRRGRRQIGKFGIGKLATYTIASRLTYLTKTEGQILSVTVDFRDFEESATGASKKIALPVRRVDSLELLTATTGLHQMLQLAGVDPMRLSGDAVPSWTIALLEDLKDKARKITLGRLQWVLSTAMPLRDNFRLFLNCEEVTSSKEAYARVVEFVLQELPEKRLEDLGKATGEAWRVESDGVKSPSFPSGIIGKVMVTERTLVGKSDDVSRSHGFYVRVRGRLLNETDPFFGLVPMVHGTFSRFRADIEADDLDDELKSSRETIEESPLKEKFRSLLREVFNETDKRYQAYLREKGESGPKTEGSRTVVAPELVEYRIADAIISHGSDPQGPEADEGWFYLELGADVDVQRLVQDLYTAPRSKYQYEYSSSGRTGRLVKFHPATSTFWINADHDLCREYRTDGRTRVFLEDLVTAEALLEVYLRESQVSAHIVGDVLERRDSLLRSLARDHSYSPEMIAASLEDAATDKYELEISLVVAARSLGFVATHISGPGQPDGIARFVDYPGGEQKITLEAKSSETVPSLSAIDFAGLREHMDNHQADGCLLLAPAYPGSTREDDSAAAARARQQGVSCWTVEQLARFIRAAQPRGLAAPDLLKIVLEAFSPEEVNARIDARLAQPTWDDRALYAAVLDAIKTLGTYHGLLSDRSRSVDMIAPIVAQAPKFAGITIPSIEDALQRLAAASQGGMTIRSRKVAVHVSHDELERRLSGMTSESGQPRRRSNFRE